VSRHDPVRLAFPAAAHCRFARMARDDFLRMMVRLATFRLEHGEPPGKSKGELSPAAV